MTPTMRATLNALASRSRLTGAALAAVLWPGKDPEPRKSIAEGRLRAAAKAGYAHVAFEPHSWTKDHVFWTENRATYEISAAGRAARLTTRKGAIEVTLQANTRALERALRKAAKSCALVGR